MPIRYNGQDNRLVYGNVPVKSVMVGDVCLYGDDIGYSTLFIYSEKSDGTISIDGLTEKGKTLVQITIPQEIGGKSVVSISDEAFLDNQVMQTVTIPTTITHIGLSAFEGCSYLTQINWNAISVDDFTGNDCAFNNAGKLGDGITVTFGDNVQRIPTYAFYSASASTAANIKNVNIGSNVISIGAYAFSSCSNLGPTVIPDNVTTIETYAFRACKSMTSVVIGNGVTSIGNYAFRSCSGLTSITIPGSVTSIGDGAFSDCSGLTSITVTDGNPKYHSAGNCLIETSTKTLIAGCKTSIIPNDGSVTSIGDRAFYYCRGLTSVTIPVSVESIGNYAFYWCDITSITIPDSVESIGSDAFSGCSGLTSVYYTGGVASWCGISFGNSSANPLTYADNLYIDGSLVKNLVIPNSVPSIGNYAFYNYSGLTSVSIPDSVTSIGNYAFWNCSGLTSITIPDNVTSIGDRAFYGCDNLTSATFENTNGWQVSAYVSFSSYTELSSSDLANTSTAATYLNSTYDYYYWRRV